MATMCQRMCPNSCGQVTQNLSETAFRKMEKRFKFYKPDKRRDPDSPKNKSPDFTDVVDLRKPDLFAGQIRHAGQVGNRKYYEILGTNGLYVCPDALDIATQQRLIIQSVTELPGSLNPNNLTNLGNVTPKEYVSELRWVTLGAVFDWTTRTYDPSRSQPMPPDVVSVCTELQKELATVAGDAVVPRASTFEPHVGIVNYYPEDMMMLAHQDVSETKDSLDRPLVSITLGRTAIFLMGGQTRDVPPVPVFVRSGDVVFMTGSCRTAYHGVPRIMGEYNEVVADEAIHSALRVARDIRININCRQIFEKVC
eukprot:PhF_6_TR19008/c0_g1_i1/m.27863/K10765/ALKBH1; alkylated DNA repair protein alkB homolog 1